MAFLPLVAGGIALATFALMNRALIEKPKAPLQPWMILALEGRRQFPILGNMLYAKELWGFRVERENITSDLKGAIAFLDRLYDFSPQPSDPNLYRNGAIIVDPVYQKEPGDVMLGRTVVLYRSPGRFDVAWDMTLLGVRNPRCLIPGMLVTWRTLQSYPSKSTG